MKSGFILDSLLTPELFTIIYSFLLLIAILAGLKVMFGGYNGVTAQSFSLGLLTIVGGAVGAKIWCDIMIAFFKINKNVQAKKRAKNK